eukprot:1637974-Amphidinium_carterae.1
MMRLVLRYDCNSSCEAEKMLGSSPAWAAVDEQTRHVVVWMLSFDCVLADGEAYIIYLLSLQRLSCKMRMKHTSCLCGIDLKSLSWGAKEEQSRGTKNLVGIVSHAV